MTTLRDRPEPGESASRAGQAPDAAHCPHCGGAMSTGVEHPWPVEPALCPECRRWVGRGRALPAPPARTGHETNPSPAGQGERLNVRRERRGPRTARRGTGRPNPIERRRARELGPPPVPRSLSPDEEEPAAAEEHDLGFAPTTAWDAPGANGASESAESSAPQAPAEEGLDDAHGSTGLAQPAVVAAPETPPPADATQHFASLESDGSEREDRTAADAGEFVEGHHPEGAAAAAPEVSAHEGDGGSDVEAPAQPIATLPASDRGGTLPFWSVPSEPEKKRRRFSLPRPRRPRLRRPTRAGLWRALPIVLLVIGALLLVEGALTVFWKEPFSAIFAAQSQGKLGGDLDELERKGAAEAAAARDKKAFDRLARRRSVSLNAETGTGKPLGRLRVKKLGLNEVVVQGTDDATIQKGPGHYAETPLPGQKGKWTVGIAGHRTTYGAPFRRINELKRGDDIVFTVPYGRFTYEVNRTRIVDAAFTEAFVPKGKNQIVLTACHPLYSAAQRILVYGELKKSEPRDGKPSSRS